MVLLHSVGQRIFKVVLDTAVDGEPQAVPLGGKTLGLVALLQCVAPGVDSREHHAVFPGEQIIIFQFQPCHPCVVHIGEPQHRSQKRSLRIPALAVLIDADAGDAVFFAEVPHGIGCGTVHPVAEQAVVGAAVAEFFQQGRFVQCQDLRKAVGGKGDFFFRHLPG